MVGPRRDVALDVIRGVCVVSMVIGHLADGSPLYRWTHGQVWVDGATGFVLLAGLVVGLVQRRAASLPAGLRVLARRARIVWTAQVALVLGALVLAPWSSVAEPATPPAAAVGGWGSALWQTLTMRLNPVDVDILSLYVVLFGVAAVAVLLLRTGRPVLLAVLSGAVYVVGLLAPSSSSLPRYVDGPGSHFDVLTWQALFVSALLVGWHWQDPRVRAWLARRDVLLGAASVVAVAVALRMLVEHVGDGGLLGPSTPAGAVVEALVDNSVLGVGRIAIAWAVFLLLYRALHSRRAVAVTAPVAAFCDPIGRRSLAAYVILSVVDLSLQVVGPYDSTGWAGLEWVVLTLLAAWTWSRLRDIGAVRVPRWSLVPDLVVAPTRAPVRIAADATR